MVPKSNNNWTIEIIENDDDSESSYEENQDEENQDEENQDEENQDEDDMSSLATVILMILLNLLFHRIFIILHR